jgi:hypothetical protein
MATYQQYQVEPIQMFLTSYGFTISNQHHRPLFSVVYSARDEAEAAHDTIEATLATAIEVSNYPDFLSQARG